MTRSQVTLDHESCFSNFVTSNFVRIPFEGFIERELEYKCSTCGSVAVIEEDESVIHPKSNLLDAAAPQTKESSTTEKVTQSPSLSSIGSYSFSYFNGKFSSRWQVFVISDVGSAASLDQNNDIGSTNDPQGNNHESDIEIISNPSQSSIEVLEIHGRYVLWKFRKAKFAFKTYNYLTYVFLF